MFIHALQEREIHIYIYTHAYIHREREREMYNYGLISQKLWEHDQAN